MSTVVIKDNLVPFLYQRSCLLFCRYILRMWSIADTPGIANYFLAYTPGYLLILRITNYRGEQWLQPQQQQILQQLELKSCLQKWDRLEQICLIKEN